IERPIEVVQRGPLKTFICPVVIVTALEKEVPRLAEHFSWRCHRTDYTTINGRAPLRVIHRQFTVFFRLRAFVGLSNCVIMTDMNRREVIAALASTAALPLMSACNHEQAPTPLARSSEADSLKLLDDVANNLLRLSPESATSL